MSEIIILGTGGDIPVVREIVWSSNSYKNRALKEENLLPSPIEIIENLDYYYVLIKYSVWPEIYGKQLPIHFPTFEAAFKFAKNNCSVIKPMTRVYQPDGELLEVFRYNQNGHYVEKV